MSTVIRNGRIESLARVLLDDDANLPADGLALVSLQRWQAEPEALLGSGAEIGVSLPNTVNVADVIDSIRERPIIALQFPAFADGRAYSQARLLRERYGYQGEICAMGDAVVLDQLQSMMRCGFNSFVLRADQDADRCLRESRAFSLAYQPLDAETPVVSKLRHQAA